MTKLLISVRDVWEAQEALAGGAEIIDVKEPRAGSLGAASPETWQAVRRACESNAENFSPLISVALGELTDGRLPLAAHELAGISYAKVGMAGCKSISDWNRTWRKWIAELPIETEPVAVVYADYRESDSPTPREMVTAAVEARVEMLLIDTSDKRRGDLFRCMPAIELAETVECARQHGLRVAFAGSITIHSLDRALSFEPDVIAVRGGVCRAGRTTALDRELVKRFASRLSTPDEERAARRQPRTIDGIAHPL